MSVANIISEGNSFRLHSTMQTATKQGMCTFDQCMFEKYKLNLISYQAALDYMKDETIIFQLKKEQARRDAAQDAAYSAAGRGR